MKCGSRSHRTERYQNVVIRDQVQQQQLEESSYDSFSSSSYEGLQEHMQECSDSTSFSCPRSKECACQINYDSDSESYNDSCSKINKL